MFLFLLTVLQWFYGFHFENILFITVEAGEEEDVSQGNVLVIVILTLKSCQSLPTFGLHTNGLPSQEATDQLYFHHSFIKWKTNFNVITWKYYSEHHLPMQKQVTSRVWYEDWRRETFRKNYRCWVRLFFGLLARLYSELPNEGLSPSPTSPHFNIRNCLKFMKC